MEIPTSPFTSEPKAHPAEVAFLKYRHYIFGVLFATLGLGIYLMLTPPTTSLANDNDAIVIADIQKNAPIPTDNTQIVVDIAGAVANPGVYFLNSQSIVEDGIKAAGGFSNLADIDVIARTINRAARVESHSKIYIPKRGEPSMVSQASSSSSSVPTSQVATSKININTATSSQLDLLPGIGPVTAQRIIDHRIQNGDFATIEEIMDVPGISDAKFDQLKNLITV